MTKLKNLQRNGYGRESAADISIRIGTRATFEVSITSTGLLSVSVLVSGILLSTAVIIIAAGRTAKTL